MRRSGATRALLTFALREHAVWPPKTLHARRRLGAQQHAGNRSQEAIMADRKKLKTKEARRSYARGMRDAIDLLDEEFDEVEDDEQPELDDLEDDDE